jgi:hypothetical protein
MEPNDIIFYIIIAASVIGSIVKAVKKKPEEHSPIGKPEQKGSTAGEIFKTLLEEMKEEDYIPTNPDPKPVSVQGRVQPEFKPGSAQPARDVFRSEKWRDDNLDSSETKPRREIFKEDTSAQEVAKVEYLQDPFLASLDFSQVDELKRAIVYSEILRPKF